MTLKNKKYFLRDIKTIFLQLPETAWNCQKLSMEIHWKWKPPALFRWQKTKKRCSRNFSIGVYFCLVCPPFAFPKKKWVHKIKFFPDLMLITGLAANLLPRCANHFFECILAMQYSQWVPDKLSCINPFVSNTPFLYPLKTSENRNVALGTNDLITWYLG